MERKIDLISENIAKLKVSAGVQRAVEEFTRQVINLYAGDLASVNAFGSAVTGDYEEGQSDVNLLIVHSDLDLEDLQPVAELSRRWLQKQKLAPRFLSRRNLIDSSRYFQIDFLDMRDAHVVLCGEDLLAPIEMRPNELRWQIAYEIKAVRMRIKQQFWRAAGDTRLMRSVLVGRFTSLVHLMRALLLLKRLPAPLMRKEILAAAGEHLGIDRQGADQLLRLRQTKTVEPPELLKLFATLMELIRIIDARVEEVER